MGLRAGRTGWDKGPVRSPSGSIGGGGGDADMADVGGGRGGKSVRESSGAVIAGVVFTGGQLEIKMSFKIIVEDGVNLCLYRALPH